MEVDDRSMDMMAMMMQVEKLPVVPEPVFLDPQFSIPTLQPILPNSSNVVIPSTLINNNPPPSPSFLNINPIQGRARNNNNNNNINNYIINAPYPSSSSEKRNNCNSMAAMREMIFRIAVMQPIHIDPESIKPPKRRNVKISKDPQSVAARHRRERISERIRILQRLVPGGTKMDTASMLDEAIHYLKFLKKQVQTLEQAGANRALGFGFGMPNTTATTNANYSCSAMKAGYHQASHMVVGATSMQMLS